MKSEDPEEELKSHASFLFKEKRKNPFDVPEHYFDSLPTIIQEKIHNQKKTSWYEVLIQSILKPQVSLLFMIVILITSGFFYFYYKQQNADIRNEMVLSAEDLKNADILGDLDENDLISEMTASQETKEPENAEDSEFENYLIENRTDLNQIIHEL